ncbi:MAG: sugar-binding protein [Victivallaceae bacterium]|nr:sugar-binding protein [Victivallaceae bacterium]
MKSGCFNLGIIFGLLWSGGLSAAQLYRIEFEKETVFPKVSREYLLLRPCDKQAPPRIDGRLTDPCWGNAEKIEFSDTVVKLIYDDKNLYIGFECKKNTPLKANLKGHDIKFWNDDNVEIFIDSNHDHKTYYQFAVTPQGARYDGFIMDKKWDGDWQSAVTAVRQEWTAEIAIPWKTVGLDPLIPGTVLGINFNSNHESKKYASWARLSGASHHEAGAFNHLIPGNSDIVVKDIKPGTPIIGPNILFLKVLNKDKQARYIRITAETPGTKTSEKFSLRPGENEIEAGYMLKEPKETGICFFGEDTATGKLLFRYCRNVTPQNLPLIYCMASTNYYYPSDNNIATTVFIENIPLRNLARMRLQIKAVKDGHEIFTTSTDKITSRKIHFFLYPPKLEPGNYKLDFQLFDEAGKNTGKTSRMFSLNKGPFD